MARRVQHLGGVGSDAGASGQACKQGEGLSKGCSGAGPSSSKGGRKPARVYDAGELAALLAVPVATVERMLRAPGRSFFTGARYDERERRWLVPEREVTLYMGMRAERLYTLRQVAELWAMSYDALWEHCKAGNVPTVRVLGMPRIAESVVMRPPGVALVPVREPREAALGTGA